MAIYHFQAQIISRGSGKSSVAAAAYRSGEKLVDERLGMEHDYTRKQGIEYTEILTPSNAPEWASDRNKLWNEVEKIEKSNNSQLAREINIALPVELSKDQQIELTRKYVQENFVNKGMVADFAIHDKADGNPHAHVMLTIRPFNEDGSWGAKAKKEYMLDKNGKKIKLKSGEYKSRKIETTDWNKKETLETWREQWANYANKALERAGISERIDHRTLQDQGIDRQAQIHIGVYANAMEKKGIATEKGTRNNEIKMLNEKIMAIEKEKVIALQEYKELKTKLEEEEIKENQRYSNLMPNEKASILKAEKVIGEPLNYTNTYKALEALENMREKESNKLIDMNSEARQIDDKLNNINNTLEALQRAENDFKWLPKNMFGQYKDKNRAEALKGQIERYKSTLLAYGYRNNEDIKGYENRLREINKNIGPTNNKIKSIDEATKSVMDGVKALENKELRDFYKEYKEHFPNDKYYFKYDEMRAVKAATKLIGRPVSVQQIKDIYIKFGSKADDIDEKIKNHECSKKDAQIDRAAAMNVVSILGKAIRAINIADNRQQQGEDLQLTNAFKKQHKSKRNHIEDEFSL